MSGKYRGSFPNRDSFQRINFLYQAAALMHDKSAVLSCHYGNMLKQIGKKSVLRIHPNIKRTLCKRCGILLKPTSSMDLEIDDEQKKVCTIKCLNCKYSRNYHINPKYNLWIENSESIVEQYQLNDTNSGRMLVNKQEDGNKITKCQPKQRVKPKKEVKIENNLNDSKNKTGVKFELGNKLN